MLDLSESNDTGLINTACNFKISCQIALLAANGRIIGGINTLKADAGYRVLASSIACMGFENN